MTKLNKVTLDVVVENVVKTDNRVNNTGRPVNKKSNRQQRLAKQAFYNDVNNKFVSGNVFNVKNNEYKYSVGNKGLGCVICNVTKSHVCNVDYIGRTKVNGYTFVLGKRVNVELNLKPLKFVK